MKRIIKEISMTQKHNVIIMIDLFLSILLFITCLDFFLYSHLRVLFSLFIKIISICFFYNLIVIYKQNRFLVYLSIMSYFVIKIKCICHMFQCQSSPYTIESFIKLNLFGFLSLTCLS